MKESLNMKKILVTVLALCMMLTVFCACEKDHYRTDLTSAEVMSSILAAIPQENGYKQVSEQYISSSTWGKDYQMLLDKVVDYHIVIAEDSDMNINEIGVFRVKDAKDVATLAAIVETFIIGQTTRYLSLLEAYNPAEIPKLDEAEVEVCGTYIYYSILSDANTDKAEDAFESAVSIK